MCMVSMIIDYGRDRYQQDYWTPGKWADYQRLIDRARKMDQAMGDPDCEDPAKKKWMDEVEQRLKALEAKPKRQGRKVP